jgi:MFS transporter, MHS family, proline/betaine transporter
MNSAQTRRVIAAGVIGNVLEWYDFAIYGYFASAIGRQFFPQEDAVAQLLSVFGVTDWWRRRRDRDGRRSKRKFCRP